MVPVPQHPRAPELLRLHLHPFSLLNLQQLPLVSFLFSPFSRVLYQRRQRVMPYSLRGLLQRIEKYPHFARGSSPSSLEVQPCVQFWEHFPNRTRPIRKEELWKQLIREPEGEIERDQSSGLGPDVCSIVEVRGWTRWMLDAERNQGMIHTIDEWRAPYNATSAAVK